MLSGFIHASFTTDTEATMYLVGKLNPWKPKKILGFHGFHNCIMQLWAPCIYYQGHYIYLEKYTKITRRYLNM